MWGRGALVRPVKRGSTALSFFASDILMPMIQITMLSGRTAEQKRKIAQRITDVMVEGTGTVREGVNIAFCEVFEREFCAWRCADFR